MSVTATSVFSAHSPQARAISHLFEFDLIIAAVIFVTVAALVLYATARFRHRHGDAEPRQDEGNPRLEIIWTIVPALILVALFSATAYTMNEVNPPAQRGVPNVVVIAHQWWWEYRYPRSGVLTANELHLPANEKAVLQIRSADVIHDFWVPDLGAKMDAIPGHPNTLVLEPQRSGTYLGTCAEFCGNQHALMGIRVVVQPAGQFAAWQKSQLRMPVPSTAPLAERGGELFASLTCKSCHTVAGTPAVGKVGPDLSHLADRATLGAGVLTNTVANLTAWLKDPQHYKPGCNMPNLHLTDDDARAIAAYLEGLR